MIRLKISLPRLIEFLSSSSAATSTGTSLYCVCATAGPHAESVKNNAGSTVSFHSRPSRTNFPQGLPSRW